MIKTTTLLLIPMLFACTADEQWYEGGLLVIGNEPFTSLVLVTEDENFLYLDLDDEDRKLLQNAVPTHIRVKGETYEKQHFGATQTFIRIDTWELIGQGEN